MSTKRKAPVGLHGGGRRRFTLAERMAARTVKGPNCWEFQGCRVGTNGYGQIDVGGGQRLYAHRAAWTVAHGPIPDGMVVAHHCDNPRCVNPAHLFLGTQADNIHDSIRKGRYNCFGRQKLNAEQVLQIRALAKQGRRQIDIAKRFGIARNTVSGIVNGHSWQHLTTGLQLEPVPYRQLQIRGEVA